jgi:hypothetical protein
VYSHPIDQGQLYQHVVVFKVNYFYKYTIQNLIFVL